jgi:hypothetical protein
MKEGKREIGRNNERKKEILRRDLRRKGSMSSHFKKEILTNGLDPLSFNWNYYFILLASFY